MTTTSIDIDRPAEQRLRLRHRPQPVPRVAAGRRLRRHQRTRPRSRRGPLPDGAAHRRADRPSTSVLTKLDPPTSWAVRGIDGPIRASVDVTVQPVDQTRSRVAIDVDFEGHGIGKILVPLVVRRQAAKEMPENLARLKDRLETQPVSPT